MTFNLQRLFLGHAVTVESSGYLVKGKLVCYRDSERNPHQPELLVLEGKAGTKILIRSWTVIKRERP